MSSVSTAARTPVASTMLAVASLLLLVAWGWNMAKVSEEHEIAWVGATVIWPCRPGQLS